MKIQGAKASGQTIVETSDEVLKYYNNNKVPETGYMMFSGVKLCQYGKAEVVGKSDFDNLEQRLMHPNV